MKNLFLVLVFTSFQIVFSQELFVLNEPASNMPTGSIGARLSQSAMKEKLNSGYNYHLMPEIMYGVSKSLMFHTVAFVSNRNGNIVTEGGSLYAKFRFFSVDDFHSHFRIALYARASLNNSDIHQEEIETMGHNSGFEAGLIATKLIKKMAISSSISFEKAIDNLPSNYFPNNYESTATNYTLSFGKLMHPKKYTNFKQTNINLMLEFLGQTLNRNGKSFLDVVPAIQFIFNSQSRLDFAYRKQIASSMLRTAPNGVYLKLEYTFFSLK